MNTTQENTAVAAPLPASMFNRWEGQAQKENVMQSIHSLKIYNPAPGKSPDPELAGKLMIKNGQTDGKYQPFTTAVKMNILKIRKWMNGQFNQLDETGNPIMDANWEPKKGFAFTEEYFRFSKNTNEVFFKDNGSGTMIKKSIWELKQLFKMPTVNGIKNRFHKVSLDQNSIPYDDTFIKESFVIYWVFMDGQYAWEHFRLFMSSAAFGNKWDSKTKTSSIEPNSLNDALDKCFKLFNDYKEANKIDGRFDDSLLVTTLTSVLKGNFFKPTFVTSELITIDNSAEFDFITNLEAQYKEEEFNQAQQQYAQPNAIDQWESTAKQIETTVENVEPSTWTYQAPVVQQAPVVEQTPAQQKSAEANEWISIEDIPFSK